jgi:heptaprenylglyceryl phosphate synthase
LKRRIIGGQTNADDKKKMLIDRLNQEDEDRKNDIFNNSPHRKPNEKIIAGTTENTDEILRQHFLMAKIRKQTDGKVIQRPSTSDLVYNFDNVKIPNLAGGGDNMRQYSASLNFRGAVRP